MPADVEILVARPRANAWRERVLLVGDGGQTSFPYASPLSEPWRERELWWTEYSATELLPDSTYTLEVDGHAIGTLRIVNPDHATMADDVGVLDVPQPRGCPRWLGLGLTALLSLAGIVVVRARRAVTLPLV